MSSTQNDSFVLPSWVDKVDTTVAGDPSAKDTTANVVSYMIYNGFIGPELCVSPAETNPAIQINTTFQYSNPAAAVEPAMALWDPAFSVDFTNGKVGNFSYAHLFPFGTRKIKWSNSFSATEPVIGNRGPRVSSVDYSSDPMRPQMVYDRNSFTMAIHGPRRSWEGHVAYNDNHVDFETTLAPKASTFKKSSISFADCLFFDEPEDTDDLNTLLGIFTTAGPANIDWTHIWD
ncbi:MAG TPA: hypothetical protein VD997_16790 [Phycisphaerales bacterium]|nr:hypothetical protein [Phycisphaerales bacterium]